MNQKREETSECLCKLFVKGLNALTLIFLGSGLFAVSAACIITWVLLLSGCCGNEEADLVVINNSGQDVYSITLEYENSAEAAQVANGSPLLKSGESYGLLLKEGADRVTVVLSGRLDREISRTAVDFAGERLYLTLEQGGDWTLTEEWPDGV